MLLADVVAFLAVSIAWIRARLWARYFQPLALLMAAAQSSFEGPRWQLLPAYALAVFFALIWLRPTFTSGRDPSVSRRRHPVFVAVGAGLGVVALALAVALPILGPVFRFAQPEGPYAIGTLTYHWVDATRQEAFAADRIGRRQLVVQIWYPAQANTLQRRSCSRTVIRPPV